MACPGTRTRTTPPVTCRLTWLRSACSSRRLRVAAFSGCAAKVLRAARRVSPSACSLTSVLDLKAIRSPTARIVRPGRRSVACRHRSWTNVQAGQRCVALLAPPPLTRPWSRCAVRCPTCKSAQSAGQQTPILSTAKIRSIPTRVSVGQCKWMAARLGLECAPHLRRGSRPSAVGPRRPRAPASCRFFLVVLGSMDADVCARM